MASFTFDDFDTSSFDDMIDKIDAMCKDGLWEGAKVIADAIDKEIDNIPSSSLLNDREKTDLKKIFGISPHKSADGGWETYIGLSAKAEGYNNFILNKGEMNPTGTQGEPIIVVGRSIIKGTKRRAKYNFIQKGFNASKEKAEEAIKNKIEKRISELNK